MYAKFELRRLEIQTARKILGTAIGMCPKESLFKGYIDLEIELREFDRARTLYEKYLEVRTLLPFCYHMQSYSPSPQFDPSNSPAWIKFAELEGQLQDFLRARAIFELGVSQSPLSMPEVLWKAYIDFEIEEGEREAARALYERLIALSGHVKVWISYATFEAEPIPVPRAEREDEEEDEEEEQKMAPGDPERARQVFERGYKDLKNKGLKDERAALLQVWQTFEGEHGTEADVKKVESMKPTIGKKRHMDEETGQMVEDWELVFPDDERENNPSSFKFLQMAHMWKQQQAQKAKEAKSGLSGFVAASKSARNEDEDDKRTDDDEASSSEED
jgi:crooked neck